MGKSWADVLRKVCDQIDGDKSNKDIIAEKLVELAKQGEAWAVNAVMDRVDGKPRQTVDQTIEARLPPTIVLEQVEDNEGTEKIPEQSS